MREFIISVIAVVAGLAISSLSSLLFDYYSRRKLSRLERLRVQSLDSLDRIFSRAKKEGTVSDTDLQQAMSDTMNYVMTARSRRAADSYLKNLQKVFGEDAEPLIEESKKILADRFKDSPCRPEATLTPS